MENGLLVVILIVIIAYLVVKCRPNTKSVDVKKLIEEKVAARKQMNSGSISKFTPKPTNNYTAEIDPNRDGNVGYSEAIAYEALSDDIRKQHLEFVKDGIPSNGPNKNCVLSNYNPPNPGWGLFQYKNISKDIKVSPYSRDVPSDTYESLNIGNVTSMAIDGAYGYKNCNPTMK